MTPDDIAASIRQQSPQQLRQMGIVERYHALMNLGMFADEHRIGHPERPVEQWKPEEIESVIALFKSWPQEEAFHQKLSRFETDVAQRYLQETEGKSGLDRKAKLHIAAQCFSESCRDILGFTDFPDIRLVFEPGPSAGYYGGLRPDGAIQICSRNLLRGSVWISDTTRSSHFSGDLSFVELVLHESTHRLQSYMASKSDQQTPNEYTNMLVAENFYEATDAMRKINPDIYFDHPFESQARAVSHTMCSQISKQLPGRGV